jgi:SAM-dependent methyltransferase
MNSHNIRKSNIIEQADKVAKERDKWIKKNSYFYKNDNAYMKFIISEGARVLELGCGTGQLLNALNPSYGVGVDLSANMIAVAKKNYSNLNFIQGDLEDEIFISSLKGPFDFIVLSDVLGYLEDIEVSFDMLHQLCHDDTRIVIAYYSWRWALVLKLGEKLKLKMPSVNTSLLSTDDTINFLNLADFELVKREWRQLIPRSMFGIGSFINNSIGSLPVIRRLALRNYVVARPVKNIEIKDLSTTVLIPCRNEKGNIENAIKRLPQFCNDLEVIYVEGNSQDDTLDEIYRVIDKYPEKDIKVFVQDGKGKGDAVRKGFDNARGDVLMILDADLTVPPEDLPKFYKAIVNGKGEYINGTRLVYPMDDEAMRFLNFWANRTFSALFTWLLNQRLTDTLCGTKVLTKKNYDRIVANRSYFGEFDPFGDFDLIFGASKLNLKIVEVPIRYNERKYGETQISRFRHGILLLKMVLFAYKKLKII